MSEGVDCDPVAGLASGAAKKLPGPLRLTVQRSFEQIEGEPPRLEVVLPEQPVGDEQEACRPVPRGRVSQPSRNGRHQRPTHAVDRTDAGGDTLLAFEVLPVGESLEAGRQRTTEGIRVLDELCEVRSEGFGARSTIRDEGDGSRGDLAPWRSGQQTV